MSVELSGSNFVAPHFIPELGEEGLTLHEVARSLGISFGHAKAAYEKNINDYSGIEISTPSGNPVNPVVQSYALTTEDAKFFVAGYNNEVGKSYRRYLIKCEKAVHSARAVMAQTPHTKALGILEVYQRVGAMFKVPAHLVQIEAVKEAKVCTGVDFSPMLQLSPAQDDLKEEDVMLEPTELAEELGGYDTAQEVNKALKRAGLQVRTSSGWAPTELGASMCMKHAWVKGSKSGYNLKWRLSAVREHLE